MSRNIRVPLYVYKRWIYYFSPQTTKLESLQAQMKTMVVDHERDIRKRDSEVQIYTARSHLRVLVPLSLPRLSQREIVADELEHISEQHQQLSSTFVAQSEELARVEDEAKELRERLALRETELARLRQKKERRDSVSRVHTSTSILVKHQAQVLVVVAGTVF